MKIIDIQGGQGSEAWLTFRAGRFGSSEAAAMLGLSEHCTRSELLRIKHTGLEREFHDWVRRNVLDKGHAVEASTRPMIEAQIDDALYPVTCQGEGRLAASCDGLTMDGALAWECKQWNERLAAEVSAGRVPDTHMPQCQHILLVTGADRLRFTVSDGTGERLVSTEVLPSAEWFQRLRDGWARFEQDLAAYALPPATEPVQAEPMESLPAVSVRLDGALSVAGNLPTFAEALRAFIARMPAKPATDNEFATVEAACKSLKKAEDALDAAEAGALASITDVEAMRRAVADCRKLARDTRLAAEKMVERRKLELKESAVMSARRALDLHIAAVNAEVAPMHILPVAADFAAAIKGKRSIDSMQDALDTTLAAAKIAADAQGRAIRINLEAFKRRAAGLEFLFSDLHALVHKARDDFDILLDARVDKHKADEAAKEAARQAAEAQRIAQAEQRAREQEAARIAEQQRQQAEAERQAAAALAAAAAPAPLPVSEPAHPAAPPMATLFAPQPDRALFPVHPLPAVARASAPAGAEPATLTLGAICSRLGFTVGGAFLAEQLHVRPAATDKRAQLYTESQYQTICRQLLSHVGAMAELYAGVEV
jgi:predicted phage-related endonuclease